MSTETAGSTIALADEEAQVVKGLLADALASLREEIYKTEAYELRQQLKRREELLSTIISRIPE